MGYLDVRKQWQVKRQRDWPRLETIKTALHRLLVYSMMLEKRFLEVT